MTAKQLHFLNIGLLLLSGGLAYYMPFHLFLFSYAVLGPLHYLTEISWLHDRSYFLAKKKQATLFWGGGLLLFLFPSLFFLPREGIALAICLLFFVALLFVLPTKRQKGWAFFFSLLLIPLFFLTSNVWFIILFSVFLTTIIHVFFFTICFMIYGTLKESSRLGYAVVLLLLAISASFFFLPQPEIYLQSTEYTKNGYEGFMALVEALGSLIGLDRSSDIFHSRSYLPIFQFIAFAYTYHYLNWFSKTTIIGWHKVETVRVYVVGAIWVMSLLLYAIDYAIGLYALFFLSITHVLLEFPLNHRTFTAIFKACKKRIVSKE